jgi:hypothetical protein
VATRIYRVEVTMSKSDIDPSLTALLIFLQENGSKTDVEIANSIPDFKPDILGNAIDLGLIEHSGNLVWLTSKGSQLAQEKTIEIFKKAGLLGLAWKVEDRKKRKQKQ